MKQIIKSYRQGIENNFSLNQIQKKTIFLFYFFVFSNVFSLCFFLAIR